MKRLLRLIVAVHRRDPVRGYALLVRLAALRRDAEQAAAETFTVETFEAVRSAAQKGGTNGW